MPYTTWTLVISTKHAPHRPVSVYWKFQYRFPQVWHKTWLHIFARNCALPFPWHTHKNCFTRNRTNISVLMLARVETHTRSLWDSYLTFMWRASPQYYQIVRYAGSLVTVFTDLVQVSRCLKVNLVSSSHSSCVFIFSSGQWLTKRTMNSLE